MAAQTSVEPSPPAEGFSHERLSDLFAQLVRLHPDSVAVDTGEVSLTFSDLDRRAGVVARQLVQSGVRAGDRVALLLDPGPAAYVGMLAVTRLHAAYVPLDAAFPDDRIAYICHDAGVRLLLVSKSAIVRASTSVHTVVLDPTADMEPLLADEIGEPVDDLAYLIYTSGTTGRPKGVEIEHAAICNFLRVAGECYGYSASDRVYQGMTIAFDFSVEELWVPWMVGATLVPRPPGRPLVADALQSFLVEHEVTALCCVPTLLATLDERQLTGLRFLLVSGEACPQDLVSRWYTEERRFLNVYGPTEATVSATWTTVHPDEPVTLGKALPTYSTVVLDPEADRLVPDGELGELGLAGVGLARGYLGRPDLTARAFIHDFVGLPDNPSGRIYRTGDLTRVRADGAIEYHGRIDTQVKVRGYRIELTEIESVLLAQPGVAQAVVDVWEPTAGVTELVAYYSTRAGGAVDAEGLQVRLAERLPSYMVPAYFEQLNTIPLTSSDKADRKNLPPPTAPRRVAASDVVAAEGNVERVLSEVVSEVLGLDAVSVEADVFDDLGGSSLTMARLCAAARARGVDLSIRDVYRAPTVRGMAALLDEHDDVEPPSAEPVWPVLRASTAAFVLTGVAQLVVFAAYASLLAVSLEVAYDTAPRSSILLLAVHTVAVATTLFVVISAIPIAAKWLLIGRWIETEVPVWSTTYLRFWIVKTLVRVHPFVLFVGSPLYSMYLRALGAKIGRRTVVLTRHMPIATDLVSLGDDVVVRDDVWMTGYHVEGGRLRTGRVTIGDRAFVGTKSILDIDVEIGSDAQLAHASSLHRGQRVPAGQRWHGSPAEHDPTDTDFRRVPIHDRRPSGVFLAVTSTLQVLVAILALAAVLALGSLSFGVSGFLVERFGGATAVALEAVVGSGLLLFGSLTLSAVVAVTVSHATASLLRADVLHPMHGLRYSLLRTVALLSNRPLLISLLGDSELITGWMRRLGWDLGQVEQTGSNFGATHRHDAPLLCRVGTGAMISDGLFMANAEYSSTHFRLGRADIGEHSFLGNHVIIPPGGRAGRNVLLATKVMVPLSGEMRHDTGLLGSPAIPIPRSTAAAPRPHLTGDALAERLRRKRRHNLTSMALLLLARWAQLSVVAALGVAAVAGHDTIGISAYAVAAVLALPLSALVLVSVERLALLGHRLGPRESSIYEPWFWRHERLWKLLMPFLATFDGTPFRPWMLRRLGVRVGRRVFDDGVAMPEHTLVEIGDDCSLNAGSVIQCHSLEDGGFTCDHTRLGDGVTLGVGALVHYSVDLASGSVLDADAFMMKGSVTEATSRWRGNPAVPCATSSTHHQQGART